MLCVTVSAITGLYVVTKAPSARDIHEYVSAYLEQFARKPAVNPLVIRAQFGDVPGSKMAEVSGHTHAKAAANRSTGTFLIEYISSSIGRDAYFFQCSAADQRNGRHGSRTYHWIKDMNVRSELFSPSENDIMAMVDVDHYVDMNEFLTDNFQPLLVYTFQPRRVAREKGEFSYTFNAKNEVEYRVSGGGFYSHPVWNYSGDSLKFAKRFCGFAYKLSVYQLERKQMDEDHQLLLLAPLVEFSGLSAFVADIFLAGETLKRLQVAIGRYTRMFVQRNDGLTVSTDRWRVQCCRSSCVSGRRTWQCYAHFQGRFVTSHGQKENGR